MKHKSGFVYIWYDKKKKRFYVGSHWGAENDGYICSSTWMRNAYKMRKEDFKRKVISRIDTSISDLLKEESRWLGMIKKEEIGKRYYNLNAGLGKRIGHWSANEKKRLTIGQKISASPNRAANISRALKGNLVVPEERKRRISESIKKIMTPDHRETLREKCSGWSHSEQAKTNITAALTGRPVSVETKRLIGMANLGKKRSQESIERIRAASSGENNAAYGKKWVTNGIKNSRIPAGELPSDGWWFGKSRINKSRSPGELDHEQQRLLQRVRRETQEETRRASRQQHRPRGAPRHGDQGTRETH